MKQSLIASLLIGAVVAAGAASFLIVRWWPTPLPVTAAGPVTVDVMVLYNHAAAGRYAGDALTRVNHLFEVSNQIYEDSSVNLQLRLVHATEVKYEDSYNSEEPFNHLTFGSTPAFRDVEARRKTHGADIVVLMRPIGHIAADLDWQLSSVADFDRDGDSDILLRSVADGRWILNTVGAGDDSAQPIDLMTDTNWRTVSPRS